MKQKFLYHGSSRKIMGNLIPKKAKDLDKKNIHNTLKGIYASNHRKEAIAMGILKSKGIKGGSLQMQKKKGKMCIKDAIFYNGYPTQKYIYLYILPSDTFHNTPQGSTQWVSPKSVKPKNVEKLLVGDHIHLVRKATNKEGENWNKKYYQK